MVCLTQAKTSAKKKMQVSWEDLASTLSNVRVTTPESTNLKASLRQLDHKVLAAGQERLRAIQEEFSDAIALAVSKPHIYAGRIRRNVVMTELPLSLLILIRDHFLIHHSVLTHQEARELVHKTLPSQQKETDIDDLVSEVAAEMVTLAKQCQDLFTTEREHSFVLYASRCLEPNETDAQNISSWIVMEFQEFAARQKHASSDKTTYPPLTISLA